MTLLGYERRIIGTALLAVVPLAAACLLLVWTGGFPEVVTWTIVLLIVISLLVVTWAMREVIVYPLRTLVNVVSAMREEDYATRAREAAQGTIFGDVMFELNALSAAMRSRHLAVLEAAALVRAVIAEVDAAIFAFDAESRLELVNRAGERLVTGAEPGRTATELGLAELLALDEATPVDWRGARWSVRVSTFRREGETHRLLVIADISRALRQEEIRAWQRVVRVLGHEMNNSLAPIKSIAGTLEEAVQSSEIEAPLQTNLTRGLSVIARRADALARFLSGYSELARLPEPRLRDVDLAAVIRRAAALYPAVTIEDGPPVQLEADEDQLEQVLINILRNAVEAGPPVSISWRRDADAVEIVVRDHGPGLASTNNLFVPFFTTKPGGSGIGLVLSRQIAEAHGGTLTLRNCKSGCEAVLRLPDVVTGFSPSRG
ncbi:MAG TPA: ATP-binding protein [Thermoanaerobaculia bacterium]|jgi:nitrogen fixation/metabolism regulation signal transduction histidine kinase|nr:ATP-binding protein [Thermoanaerobaculia bacterium]